MEQPQITCRNYNPAIAKYPSACRAAKEIEFLQPYALCYQILNYGAGSYITDVDAGVGGGRVHVEFPHGNCMISN